MIFKTALLFGLLAGCYATPIAIKVPKSGARVLEKRIPGHISTSVDCGGMLISKEKIKAALEAGRTPRVAIGGYPADFFNLDGKNKVFNDATIIREAKEGKIREYPIGLTATWKDGDPGPYRIIFKKDPDGLEACYCGVMYHPPDRGNAFAICSEVPTPPPIPKNSHSTPPKNSDSASKMPTSKTPAPMPDLPDPQRPKGGVIPKKGGKPKGGKGGKSKKRGGA